MLQQIEAVLEEKVRAYFQSHGGDISVESYDAQSQRAVLRVHGQCSACALQNESLGHVIEGVLQEKFPAITFEVDSGVSAELWDMAKKILNKKTQD